MDRERWTKLLREAEAELDAARGKVATDAAARKLMRIRAELKAIGPGPAKRPKRSPARKPA
jgi:hypothetical protein